MLLTKKTNKKNRSKTDFYNKWHTDVFIKISLASSNQILGNYNCPVCGLIRARSLTETAAAVVGQDEARLADALEASRRVFTRAELTDVWLHVALVDVCGGKNTEKGRRTCKSRPTGPWRQMGRVRAGRG